MNRIGMGFWKEKSKAFKPEMETISGMPKELVIHTKQIIYHYELIGAESNG